VATATPSSGRTWPTTSPRSERRYWNDFLSHSHGNYVTASGALALSHDCDRDDVTVSGALALSRDKGNHDDWNVYEALALSTSRDSLRSSGSGRVALASLAPFRAFPAVLASSGLGRGALALRFRQGPRVGQSGQLASRLPSRLRCSLALRSSSLARLERSGARRVARDTGSLAEPSPRPQRAPAGLTGEHASGRRLRRPTGSGTRKRAGASADETASCASVSSLPGARAGRGGATPARWNHHARTLGSKSDRAGLKGAARSTRPGDARTATHARNGGRAQRGRRKPGP
jgi:hypothetical protein